MIVAETLRNLSHPNFIRWSIANGNTPRAIFGRALGAATIFGFLIAIFLTLSYKPRWWRFFSVLPWVLGFMFLLAGSNGICFVLYVTRDRNLRPWEQFTTDTIFLISAKVHGDEESDQQTLTGSDFHSMSNTSGGLGRRKGHFAMEAFGTANSYGHEVWVEKYRAKMIRKIFSKTVWVQNEHLRLMQDKVALQSILWSVIATVPLTALFVALPQWTCFPLGRGSASRECLLE